MSNYLPAPDIVCDTDKVAAFDALYQTALAVQGGVLDYALPYPKYEFLSYLTDHKDVILHGSNEAGIETFVPRRGGMDANPHGNLMGVYGTADGIWPMFLAVFDRKNYTGSMRNGVLWGLPGDEPTFSPEANVPGAQKFYQFSLNAEQLDKPIWTDGTIYLLARATFEQQRTTDGRLTPEWVSRVPQKPLACLPITPADFPYTQRVTGHDNAAILRMQTLVKTFVTTPKRIEELPDGYAFEFDWSKDWAMQVIELTDLTRAHFPVCTIELIAEQQVGPVWLRLRGPETLKGVMHRLMQGDQA